MRRVLSLNYLLEIFKYILAALLVTAILFLKLYLLQLRGVETHDSLMLGLILFIAIYIGIYQSVFAVIFSSISLNYFAYSPYQAFSFNRIDGLFQTLAFIVEALAIIYIVHQLLKRKKENEASEQRFKRLIENSNEGIVLFDKNDNIIYVSTGIERILGYTPEEFKQINTVELMDPNEMPLIHNLFLGFDEDYGATRMAIHRFKHKNGSWLWIESTLTNLLKDPHVKAKISNFRDISSRINLEHEQQRVIELQEKIIQEEDYAKLKFEFIADHMQHKVWMHNPDGKITYINKAWLEFAAIKDIEEWDPKNVIPPDDQEELYESWRASLKKGEEFTLEQKYRRHDQVDRWHSVKAFPIKDSSGQISSWVGVNTDIHDLKTQNQKLKASEELLAEKDEFISVASHELKTPLTSLKASLQLIDKIIKDEPVTPLISSLVSKATQKVNKLSVLVSDLLNTTKIEKGQLQLNKTVFNLHELLKDCVENVKTENNDCEILIEGDANLNVFADKCKIDQVLVNLLSNAVKYSPVCKEIRIAYEAIDKMVKVSIQDFGVGIDPEQIKYLFERFYRGDDENFQFSGLGLGLYISSKIIHQHGGEMNVISTKGKGSTFWFTIQLNEE